MEEKIAKTESKCATKTAGIWMPFYVADYLKDTQHLSTLEHGAYFKLILHAWTHDGVIPADPIRLARVTGLTPKEWRSSADILLEFFDVCEGGYAHHRVERELVRSGGLIDQRRAAGRASADARKSQRKGNERGNENPTVVATSVVTEGATNEARKPNQSQSQSHSVTNVTADSDDFVDPIKLLFDSGVDLLRASGIETARAKSIVGRWRQLGGDKQAQEAIVAAKQGHITNPVEWVPKYLDRRQAGMESLYADADRLAAADVQ